MIRTPVCDLLDIEHPIALGGMGSVYSPDLVAAVYGGMAYCTNYILPSLVLHVAGDFFPDFFTLLSRLGRETPSPSRTAIEVTAGSDTSIGVLVAGFVLMAAVTLGAFTALKTAAREAADGR